MMVIQLCKLSKTYHKLFALFVLVKTMPTQQGKNFEHKKFYPVHFDCVLNQICNNRHQTKTNRNAYKNIILL